MSVAPGGMTPSLVPWSPYAMSAERVSDTLWPRDICATPAQTKVWLAIRNLKIKPSSNPVMTSPAPIVKVKGTPTILEDSMNSQVS